MEKSYTVRQAVTGGKEEGEEEVEECMNICPAIEQSCHPYSNNNTAAQVHVFF